MGEPVNNPVGKTVSADFADYAEKEKKKNLFNLRHLRMASDTPSGLNRPHPKVYNHLTPSGS
jgi:hypothetical protein